VSQPCESSGGVSGCAVHCPVNVSVGVGDQESASPTATTGEFLFIRSHLVCQFCHLGAFLGNRGALCFWTGIGVGAVSHLTILDPLVAILEFFQVATVALDLHDRVGLLAVDRSQLSVHTFGGHCLQTSCQLLFLGLFLVLHVSHVLCLDSL